MPKLPDTLDDFQGETVFYSTGYEVDQPLIRQYYIIGSVLCLTAIGALIGLPLILRGIYLKRRSQKAIIITDKSVYVYDSYKEVWSTEITNIKKIEGRTTIFGFLQIRFTTEKGPNHIVTGNFYENEAEIIAETIFSNVAKMKRKTE